MRKIYFTKSVDVMSKQLAVSIPVLTTQLDNVNVKMCGPEPDPCDTPDTTSYGAEIAPQYETGCTLD
jgi:hypothetical protein